MYRNKLFDQTLIGNNVGFVYCITEINTGMQYIGQKVFWNKIAKKPLKGKSKRRIEKRASNWAEYYGSNEILAQRAIEYGPSNYSREIIHLCTSKAEMNYLESYEIFNRHALLFPEKYYNLWISCRINSNQIKTVKRSLVAQIQE